MAKAKKAKVKKVSRMSKIKLMKVLKEEPLVPDRWQRNVTKDGAPATGKNKIECIGCAVGTVISSAKKQGIAKNFNFNSLQLADNDKNPGNDYYKALVKGGLYLTALSDMFELECEALRIDGESYEKALTFFYEKKQLAAGKLKNPEYYDANYYNSDDNVEEFTEQIKEFNKKISKVKKKLISFVDKNYPARVPLRQETEEMKVKALTQTKYNTNGGIGDYYY